MNEKTFNDLYFAAGRDYFWLRANYEIALDILKKYRAICEGDKESHILDIGGGGGYFADELIRYGKIYVADNDVNIMEKSSNPAITKIYQDLSVPSSIAERYNVICALDVLEHIKEEKQAVNNIYKLLKSGGYFLCTVPAFHFLYSRHDEAAGHVKRYGRSEIMKLMCENGFECLYLNYAKASAFVPLCIFRLIKKILRRKKEELQTDIVKLPKFVNTLLSAVLQIDNWFARRFPLPFGTHIVYLGRKIK